MPRQRGVAPPELIRQDFRALDSHETLRTTWSIEQLILIQSVQGHAHEGHALFGGRRFPNTTMDDVTFSLRLDPERIKRDRQELIDSIGAFVDETIAGSPPRALQDSENQPLLGISTLRYLRVDPVDVLGGLYLGGLRDDSDVRQEVEGERGVKIGGGRGYLVDTNRMEEMGLGAEELAHGEWADDIVRFREEGLIVEESGPGVSYQYIRHRRGPGASDDAAIVAAGLIWGLGVAVGVFLADAIDTLEKYVPEPRDQDEEIALGIEKRFRDLRFSREDLQKLTYLAATPEHPDIEVPDSSLRHLLLVDRHQDLCAVESHFLTVEGVPVPSIGLSHERVPSHSFYDYLRRRIDAG